MKKLRQVLANKNTVTFIGIILIVLVLYFFYKWRLGQATSPVAVAYANQNILARTKITEDMITVVEVPASAIRGNVITRKNDIVGKYVNINTSVPAGSMFFSGQVVKQEELPDSFLIDIPEGYIPYNFGVNTKTTYGNSMYPGNYVDIYFKGIQEGKLMVGKLLENVKILAVKTANGQHVFETSDGSRTPSQIIFAVTPEIHLLLRKAEYINSVEIILVPSTASLELDNEDELAINITSEKIKEYIDEQSVYVDDVTITENEEE